MEDCRCCIVSKRKNSCQVQDQDSFHPIIGKPLAEFVSHDVVDTWRKASFAKKKLFHSPPTFPAKFCLSVVLRRGDIAVRWSGTENVRTSPTLLAVSSAIRWSIGILSWHGENVRPGDFDTNFCDWRKFTPSPRGHNSLSLDEPTSPTGALKLRKDTWRVCRYISKPLVPHGTVQDDVHDDVV